MTISQPAVISSARTMADGTLRIVVDFPEMNSMTVAEIISLIHKEGTFNFVER